MKAKIILLILQISTYSLLIASLRLKARKFIERNILVVMSSDSSDSDDIPDVAECQRLCEQFAEITGTDSACAQFYLQDRSWDLDRSVNDFFEDRNNKGAVRVNDKQEAQVVVVVDGHPSGLAAAATAVLVESALSRSSRNSQSNSHQPFFNAEDSSQITRKRPSSHSSDFSATEAKKTSPESGVKPGEVKPSTLKFITWNIDGLNEKNLMLRTKAVCKTIISEQADIVFVQEVVPESAEYFLKHLNDYHCLFGNEIGYFVATLLKKSTINYSDFEILEFPNTRMMRNALEVKATYKSLPLRLLNSHLESTAEGADERKVQLKHMLKEVVSTASDNTVIFAGDMNLRDKELTELGGLPNGVEDLWIACGQRKECAYTWDLTRNDNLIMNGRFKPRCRFDRAYIRHANPRALKPVHFGLVGLERLLPHRCFPSDHWGILCHFEKK
ncbi:hypothetical protein JTE90_027033 [Oedothorax gibbosus]|uniref:Tyrosyl-DNA phosphodiesterase 2 n=1 Tax=Oedothorax gibbosus TaxID=931172 RepID=A0AAV6UUV2_9ARAC|nr:hypothetical protein JTE90_027033 [Oedothorax gibbosus]